MKVKVAEVMHPVLDAAPSKEEREPIGSARRLFQGGPLNDEPSGR